MTKGRSSHTSSAGSNFGLPKADILRGRTNFNRLFSGSATVFSGSSVTLRYRLFPDNDNSCKMGFIAAKRLGKAVDRNRIKRLLKEAYRLNRTAFTKALQRTALGFHGALVAKTIDIDYQSTEQDVIHLLTHLIEELQSNQAS